MLLYHIFNVSSIVARLNKDNLGEKNLYEKVNQIFKGAITGSPELVKNIQKIVKDQSLEMNSYLDGLYKTLGGKEEEKTEKAEVQK